ncbi:MAG: right-handed parallel beta-helix repeat-containing protein [Bacillota bacterium]|nr:right-handed parallel beta-helix repeat-containing protein [Bacillota bacterium]
MKSRFFFVALVCSLLAVSSLRVEAQANVVENQTIYLHVNGTTGSDSNPGSPTQPFKTISAAVQKALANNRAGIGTKVLIDAGVYREFVKISPYNQTSAPITIQATTQGTAIIDGADLLTNWYKKNTNVYAYSWKDSVGGCPLPSGWYSGMPGIVLNNEMVFVNGQPMTQVASISQMRPGTFFVNSTYQELDLWPPSGTDMNTATVEVSNRRETLEVDNGKNLVFRGLVLQHAASCMNQNGANVFGSSNILFDDVQVNWNNWGGLGLSNSNHYTIQNSTASYNGGVGLAAYNVQNALYQNNETDYNNWRGEMVGLYDFGQGGTKIMHARSVTVNAQRSYNNAAQGLWFDTDNATITVANSQLVGNTVANLQLEANQGPITVQNTSLCSGGMGLHLINTADLTMTGNVFYNNGGNSFQNGNFFLAGKAGGRVFTNFQTGQTETTFTTNTILENNVITAANSNQYVFNTYLSGSDWSKFADSLQSNNNYWYNGQLSTTYIVPLGKHVNFSGWKSTTGQDYNSDWALSSIYARGCGLPTPGYTDFHIQAHNAAAYVSSYTMSNGSVSIPLQIRSYNYGSVQLSIYGLPSGVSASFSPSTLTSGNSVLTLKASSSATAQTVPVTIFAVSGSRVHSITLMVNVRPAS